MFHWWIPARSFPKYFTTCEYPTASPGSAPTCYSMRASVIDQLQCNNPESFIKINSPKFPLEQDSIGKVVQAFCNELPNSDLGLASSSLYFLKRGESDISTKRIIKDILAALPPRRPIDDRFVIVAAHNILPLIIEEVSIL